MSNRKIMNLSLAMIGSLALANVSPAAVWIGGTDNNWETGANWDTGLEPGSSTILSINALPGGTVVDINSAVALARDVSLDSTTADNLTVNIKNGAVLTVGEYNFDIGYTGGSTGVVVLDVELGGKLIVNNPGGFYFGRVKANPNTLIQVSGQINATMLQQDPAAVLNINFDPTGVMVLDTLMNREYSNTILTGDLSSAINTLATDGHIKVQGVGFGDAGWGVTHGINTSFDSGTNKTTITAFVVPEPASAGLVILAGLAGLVQRRRGS
jgi:hypothetical protein